MEELLPDRLKKVWQRVDRGELTAEAASAEQERLLDVYRGVWADALRLEGHRDLQESLLAELGRYMGSDDRQEIQDRCHQAVAALRREWEDHVERHQRASVERFYDESQTSIYELMWWHTLSDDLSPLAYVLALQYAKQHHCTTSLDFGSGVGSGAILFERHGLDVAVADISSPLLDCCRWRLTQRGLKASYFDLKTCRLPRESFDMITAMDVFEHLVDPVGTAQELLEALRPGGFLFGRFANQPDEDHPMHIVNDFEPTLTRLRELGGVEVWRDEWLWGHQVFQKTPAPPPAGDWSGASSAP
jgi:2-polyprenyl-3-methyl-5-hydroxy-6-metoxy-1,4-benzoquinol methylase